MAHDQSSSHTGPDQASAIITALQPLLKRVRTDVTAIKTPGGTSAWTREALTPALMRKHLNGGPARGVSQIKAGTSQTLVGLLDLDSHKGATSWDEMVEVATQLAATMREHGLQPIAFRSSGGRGIHLYVLWDEPQDAYSVRMTLTEVLGRHNYKNGAKGVARGEIEIFPKQDSVALDGFGNQAILPMAGKSEPLDLLFGETTGVEGLLAMDWPMSEPVDVRTKPVQEKPAPGSQAISIAALRTALAAIPNDDAGESPDYDAWRNIIFGIHEATDGSQDGLDLAIEFSSRNPAHDEKFLRERVWPYARSEKEGGITHRSILAQARAQGWNEPHELSFTDMETGDEPEVEPEYKGQELVLADDIFTESEEAKRRKSFEGGLQWKDRICAITDEFALRESLCPDIARDHDIEQHDREKLAQVLVKQFAGLGVKYPIGMCRKLIAPAKRPRQIDPERTLPEWAQGWVFVTDDDKFFKMDSDQWLTSLGFRAAFNRFSLTSSEDAPDAARDALDNLQIPVVTRGMYLPWAAAQFDHDGTDCVNTYRPSTVPAAVPKITPRGQMAIDGVLRHLRIVCDGREWLVEILLSWIAHNVQHPGKKIRWAPLIKGVQGDGKTIIGKIVTAVMGRANTKNVSPHALASSFSAWAAGSCVAVLEEVRILGQNRYDIFNALKPYITNDDVPAMDKGADERQIVNVTNYVGFTNFNDAMPLDDNDRRWMVVFSPFTSIVELGAAVGGDLGAYFDSLNSLIESQRADLRRFFLDYKLSAMFKPNGHAPHTEERLSMIGLAGDEDEGLFDEIVSTGSLGVTSTVLASSYLNAAIQAEGGDGFQTSAFTKILKKKGWTKAPQRIRWNGKPEWVWVKGAKSTETKAIQEVLERSRLGTASLEHNPLFDEVEDRDDELWADTP